LGVTPSAWASSHRALQLSNGGAFVSDTGTNISIARNSYYASGSWRYIANSTAQAFAIEGDGAYKWFNAPSGTAGNAITFTQAMTLDASGRLGIGTTSPSAFGVTAERGGSDSVYFTANSTSGYTFIAGVAPALGYGLLGMTTNHALAFLTNNTERARIDTSGNLLVGLTTNSSSGKVSVAVANGGNGITVTNTSGTAQYNAMAFYNNGPSYTNTGAISVSGSATSYNTSSDYRLKNTIAPMTGALAKVALLKPCTYKWNADGSDGEGFIAHELAEVCPQAVSGEKDAVDEDGNPKYQGIDTSFLVATLTAALQEAVAEINSLKARLDAANL
jgi:hypothetical protein